MPSTKLKEYSFADTSFRESFSSSAILIFHVPKERFDRARAPLIKQGRQAEFLLRISPLIKAIPGIPYIRPVRAEYLDLEIVIEGAKPAQISLPLDAHPEFDICGLERLSEYPRALVRAYSHVEDAGIGERLT